MKRKSEIPQIRGYLMHITHYDPRWIRRKPWEKPFDLSVGKELIDAMAEVGMNLLSLDIADGVKYKSHPELAKKYSVPMSELEKLAAYAKKQGIAVMPKLNFSRGRHYRHNNWMQPHTDAHYDDEEYFKIAFELIDEVLDATGPVKYFHIGMDEDDNRILDYYVNAIKILHDGLKKRKIRTVMWNDGIHYYDKFMVIAEKARNAVKEIPKDIIQIPWCYSRADASVVRGLVKAGFEVWGAHGWNEEQAREWKKVILENGGSGLFMTRWIKCVKKHRNELLQLIRTVGAIHAEQE